MENLDNLGGSIHAGRRLFVCPQKHIGKKGYMKGARGRKNNRASHKHRRWNSYCSVSYHITNEARNPQKSDRPLLTSKKGRNHPGEGKHFLRDLEREARKTQAQKPNSPERGRPFLDLTSSYPIPNELNYKKSSREGESRAEAGLVFLLSQKAPAPNRWRGSISGANWKKEARRSSNKKRSFMPGSGPISNLERRKKA